MGGAWKHDLELVPHKLRGPLQDFIRLGHIPTQHPDAMALLSGDLAMATRLHEASGNLTIAGAQVFIENHCPDVAWGAPAYLLRWQRHGGMKGRAPQ